MQRVEITQKGEKMIQPTNLQMPYPQQGGANAVAINIYNPQAYGATPNAQMAQNTPYQVQQPIYQVPYAPAYSQAPVTNPMAYQQFMPVNNVMNAPVMPNEPQFIAPAPQAMPESVIIPEATTQAAAEVTPAPVEIVEPQQTVEVINIDNLIQNLKSTDANTRTQTINQLASYAQEAPEIAYQIVAEPIMQALVNIINEDTSKLQGPTKEQNAIAEKMAKGETLTAEEQALADQISPLDMANHNRTIAIYTLAMIQKLQREEMNDYIANQIANGEQPCTALTAQDLIGYQDMVNVIKNDPSLKVRIAAIEGLQHIVEPQDKEMVEPVLVEAQKSSNEDIKAAATEALAKFAA